MKWYTTETKPYYDKYITVVHNIPYVAGKTELCTTTGILKVMSDNGWTVLSRNTGMGNFIPLTDIHGWCYEEHLAQGAFYRIYQEPVGITCPVCGKKATVIAKEYNTYYSYIPVVMNTLNEHISLDWDDIDAECDFEYVCSECGEKVAPDLMTLQKIVEKQLHPITDFTDDADKMLDFFLLSKEQFLESYSYITEEEWNNTLERVKKEWMPNGKKGN